MKHTKLSLIFEKPDLTPIEQALLYLVPLVQTAWAHGAISKRETYLIFAAAREDSIDERDSLNETLDELLKYQPSREFFEVCLTRIAEDLRQMTVRQRTALREKILGRCRKVASSAGEKSPSDLNHRISPEERILLERFNLILP